MPAAPHEKPDDDWQAGGSFLKGAVLLLVLERPGHAHDVAKRLRQRLGAAWGNQLNDVYALIKRLERKGLLEGRYEVRRSRPREEIYVYHPTARTAGAAREWFAKSIEPEPESDELLAMLAVSREEDAPELLRRLDEFERACSQSKRAHDQEFPTDSWLGMTMEIVRKAVVTRRQAKIEWAEEARSWIEERRAPGP